MWKVFVVDYVLPAREIMRLNGAQGQIYILLMKLFGAKVFIRKKPAKQDGFY